MAKEGDKNTKYFHGVTAERRKLNRMECIKADNRGEYRGEKEIAEEITRHFESLFTTEYPEDYNEVFE